jgi:hypothetical protein
VIWLEHTSLEASKMFTEEEEESFRNLSKTNIYERISRSIAPSHNILRVSYTHKIPWDVFRKVLDAKVNGPCKL